MAYAEGTTVSFEKSVAEIVTLLKRAGAAQIGQMDAVDYYAVQFTLENRMVRFRLPLPKMADMPLRDGRNAALTPAARQSKLDQAGRQRGRALLLTIKAKLESIESGIETFEEAFLAHVVMSDGRTVYERVSDPVRIEYESGRMPDTPWLLEGPKR